MFDYKNIDKLPHYHNQFTDTEKVTNGKDFVKKLRDKLQVSQRVFAKAIGVKTKTVDLWENYKKVDGAKSRLLYLLNKHPELFDELYKFKEDLLRKKRN